MFSSFLLNPTIPLIVLSFFLIELLSVTESLRFYVASNDKKCLKEEIHKNVVLTGEYELSDAIGHTTTVHVSFSSFSFFQIINSIGY